MQLFHEHFKPRLLNNMHNIDTKNHCIILEISCLQAVLDRITLSSTHYAY